MEVTEDIRHLTIPGPTFRVRGWRFDWVKKEDLIAWLAESQRALDKQGASEAAQVVGAMALMVASRPEKIS